MTITPTSWRFPLERMAPFSGDGRLYLAFDHLIAAKAERLLLVPMWLTAGAQEKGRIPGLVRSNALAANLGRRPGPGGWRFSVEVRSFALSTIGGVRKVACTVIERHRAMVSTVRLDGHQTGVFPIRPRFKQTEGEFLVGHAFLLSKSRNANRMPL